MQQNCPGYGAWTASLEWLCTKYSNSSLLFRFQRCFDAISIGGGILISEPPQSRVGGVWMSFSFLNVIYPFFILSLFLNLEEGLLEEFLVLHLVTGVHGEGWIGLLRSYVFWSWSSFSTRHICFVEILWRSSLCCRWTFDMLSTHSRCRAWDLSRLILAIKNYINAQIDEFDPR